MITELLKKVERNSIWGEAIHACLERNGDVGELVLELQSQWFDNPTMMESIVGRELCRLLIKPFKPTMDKAGKYAITKLQTKY